MITTASRSLKIALLAERQSPIWLNRMLAVVVFFLVLVSTAGAGEPEAPSFSISGGVYTNTLVVELKASVEGVIRYSLDGSEPDLNSPTYTGPLKITNCALVRAKAFSRDGSAGQTVSQSYVLLDDDLRQFSSNLPLIVLNSASGEIAPTEKTIVATRIIAAKSGRVSFLSAADFDGMTLANIRGHSSLRYPKHSYNIKVINGFGEPHKVSLLDLPKESDWVLYGPYPDKTLMRDMLAYELSNQMGRWAPHGRFVEVFVREAPGKLGMENYVGVYILLEKITRDKNRLDLAKLDPSDNREPEVSGAYIFKKDHSSRRERKKYDADGPPQAPLVTNRAGFPTPPGGFPADPAGFLPSYDGKTTTRSNRPSNRLTEATRLGRAPAPPNVAPPRDPVPPPRTAPPTRGPAPKKLKPNAIFPVTNYVPVAIPETIKIDDETIFHDDEAFRTTLQRNQFYFYEPEPDELTAVQRAWVKDYVNRFEDVLYGPDFTNKTSGFRAFIDEDSFIDYHLLTEVTKNVDSFRFSTFYYKDRGGRLNMGPLWDWNLSFGNANGKQGWLPEHWLWPQLDDQQYSWFRRLFEDVDFAQRYVDRWAQLRTNILVTAKVLARVDQLAAVLQEAQERNFDKWDILGKTINPNWFVGDTYEEEIEWMKGWITNRLAWIENQFVATPTAVGGASVPTSQAQSVELRTEVSDAKIYFTLDGSDPRASGGGVSAKAQAYQAALTPPKNSRLIARVLSGARWSAPTVVSFAAREERADSRLH